MKHATAIEAAEAVVKHIENNSTLDTEITREYVCDVFDELFPGHPAAKGGCEDFWTEFWLAVEVTIAIGG